MVIMVVAEILLLKFLFKACKVCVACAILHNLAKRRNVPMPNGAEPDMVQDPAPADVPQPHNRAAAQAARQAFIEMHFR